MYLLAEPTWQQGGGESSMHIMENFVVSLIASIVCYYMTKWLEEHEHDGK